MTTTTLSIPDMSCGHCRASITEALTALPGVEAVTFDQDQRRATITGAAPLPTLIATLDAIGFPASAA